MKLRKEYDCIIIGSGFGGSMAAQVLAAKGKSVLMADKGKWPARDDSCWDENLLHLTNPLYRGENPIYVDQKDGVVRQMWTDDTVGGMSTMYGAVSFRMREDDFYGPPQPFAGERDSSFAWPYTYRELEPFYRKAEKMLGVAGIKEKDITEPPFKGDYPQEPNTLLSTPSKKLWEASSNIGLHPFFLPMAINFSGKHGKNKCILCSTCDHYLCKIEAKNDLPTVVLPQALKAGLQVLHRTMALRINTVKRKAVSVDFIGLDDDKVFTVKAKRVICSGGALFSPYLLLLSGIDRITGNTNIGHHLMRHINGVVAGVFTFKTNPEKMLQKQIGIPDFYFGDPAGEVEPYGAWGMIQDVSSIGKGVIKANAPLGLKNIAALASDYLINLLCIAEDIPQYDNAVFLDASRRDKYGQPSLGVYHRYHQRDIDARNALYLEARRILKEAGSIFFYNMPIETFSHGLGTCRMGLSPVTSVVDENCRVHGMENLYVIDGSVMPSGGSVNPSLTIAALSLKAAASIV